MGIMTAQKVYFTKVAPVTHPEEMSPGRGKAREGFDEEESL